MTFKDLVLTSGSPVYVYDNLPEEDGRLLMSFDPFDLNVEWWLSDSLMDCEVEMLFVNDGRLCVLLENNLADENYAKERRLG